MTLHVGDAAEAAVEEVEELFEAASFTDVLWGVVSVLVLAFFFALILHSVWKSAQDHPAAVEKRPNGVRGGLLLVAAYLLALGLFRLASAANIVAYLNAVGGEAATLVMNMKFAGPAALAALISFIGCHRLACGRRPLAAAAAIAMVLIHKKAAAANMRLENEVRIKEKELQLARTELDKLSAEQKEATAQIIALQRKNAALEAEKKSDEEKEKADSIRQQLMNAEFERLAGSILEHNRRVFLDTNRNELDKVLSPLKEKLSEFGETVRNTYNADTRERFSLQQQIEKLVTANKQISDDARRLAQALKGNTKIQGDWGEHILETMLEHSGLTKGREYVTQETLRDKTGKPLTSES